VWKRTLVPLFAEADVAGAGAHTSRVAQFELARKRTRQSKCRHLSASSRAKGFHRFISETKKKFRSFRQEEKVSFGTSLMFGVHELQKKSTGALLTNIEKTASRVI
jgi:hypothetical protein